MTPTTLAIEDSPKIQRHEKYKVGDAPDFEKSDHIVFVLVDLVNNPESFLKKFKDFYSDKYDGKKLVFLHSCGGHWTTYECDYKYDHDSEPVIKRHEIRGDGRCGLHAVAKALAIVGNKPDLVEENHETKSFQVPDSVGTVDDKIFAHLGLDKEKLGDIWIGRVEIEDSEGGKKVIKEGTKLIARISQLHIAKEGKDWLSNEDIENILLETSICPGEGKKICLASPDEPFKILPGEKEIRLGAEILSIILDDNNWYKDKCTKSFDKFPQDKQQYFQIYLSSSTTRNDALKTQLERFGKLKYSKDDNGKIVITSGFDDYERIADLQVREKFCQFAFENIGSSWLDDEAKKLIHQTLMFLKIRNMHAGQYEHDKYIFSTKFYEEDRAARNNLYDELLKFYPSTGNAEEKIDDSKKAMIRGFLRQAFTDGIEIKEGTTIKISGDKLIATKGNKADEYKIRKINSVNFSDCDKEKFKTRRFLALTKEDGETKVLKVNLQESGIECKEIKLGRTSYEAVLYSEYVRYAEENKKTESDFFAFQPKKFQGYGIEISLDANHALYLKSCFNDDYKAQLQGKEGKQITKINGETLQTHLIRARLLGIEPEYYINSLVRLSYDEIKLGFKDGSEVELSKKKVFEKSDDGLDYKEKERETIDVNKKKEEVDRMMIGVKEGVRFADGARKSDGGVEMVREAIADPSNPELGDSKTGSDSARRVKRLRFAEGTKEYDGDYTKVIRGITDETKKWQFKAVIKHIDTRFELLKKIIRDQKPKVIIFAKDKNKAQGHSLGTGLAVNQWADKAISDYVSRHIEKKIKELEDAQDCQQETYDTLKQKKLNKLSGGKTIICRGPIYSCRASTGVNSATDSDFAREFSPSEEVIHVWGANVDNFNLARGTKITGGGQAEGIGNAQFGKFGIVTTNISLRESNKDKLQEKDLIYQAEEISGNLHRRPPISRALETQNTARAINGIKDALTMPNEDLLKVDKHFDWWFVNDFPNGGAKSGACKYSAEDKQSLLGNEEYLRDSLDLASRYFDELLNQTQGSQIYGIRLMKIYNYLTILQFDKENNRNSLFKSNQELSGKLEDVILKLEAAIVKGYRNKQGNNEVLNHDGLIKLVAKPIVEEAKTKAYHQILKNRVESPSPSPAPAGIKPGAATEDNKKISSQILGGGD